MKPPLRIALADDEVFIRECLRRWIVHWGHRVVAVAADGRELIAMCRESSPDLVISDVMMPEVDGLTAAAEICRERPVPVVFMSALFRSAPPDLPGGVRVLGCLPKPFQANDLGRLLQTVVGSPGRERVLV
ncbi:MAG TPA: response regulator [Gemmataceae bacterium]